MTNQTFFEYLRSLLKGAHLDTALEETQLFLVKAKEINRSNSYLVSQIEANLNDLVLLQSQLNIWHQEKDITDSRSSNTEIRRIYNSFMKYCETLQNLPEMGYNEFGDVRKSPPINVPVTPISTWQKVILFFVVSFVLTIFGILAYNAYQAFYPKSDEPIDNTRCWVKTNPVFAQIMHKPNFMPTDIIGDLPGSKKYHVLEIKEVGMGKKCYRIKDERLGIEGWVGEQSLSKINVVCFNESEHLSKKQIIDKTKCWITTAEFTQVYHKAQHMPEVIAQLESSKDYQVLDVKRVFSGVFFKIKDEETGVEGWVQNFGLKYASPKCFD